MPENLLTAAPKRQIAFILGGALLIAAVLAAAYFAWFRPGYAVLFTDLREADAATIVAELEAAKTPYKLADGGQTILVAEDAVDGTRIAVMGKELPLKGAVGFELFNSSSLGLTEFAQRINFQRALQGEIARTIMAIDGVDSARVHLALAEQTVFRGDRKPARASVTVLMRRGRRLAEPTVRGIQRLVAAAVPELDAGSVVVLNGHGAVASGEAAQDMPELPGMERKRATEQYYEARVRRQLDIQFPRQPLEVVLWAVAAPAGRPVGEPVAAGPRERDYGLRAAITVAGPLREEIRQRIVASTEDAIGFDPSLGDSVTVTASTPAAGTAEWGAASAPAEAVPAPAAADQPLWTDGMWTGLALLALCIAAFFIGRRPRVRPAMSEDRRLQYVRRLGAILDQRDADAAL